ncbi:MAG: hypothetical protein ACOCX1_00570 [Fimbriimonadaceae bacterium]
MKFNMRITSAGIALGALTLMGCQQEVSYPWPEWVPEPSASQANLDPEAEPEANAYGDYDQAAAIVVRRVPDHLSRVYFTSGMKRIVRQEIEPARELVYQAFSRPFTPEPFRVDSERSSRQEAAWRLIGQSMVWDMEDALVRQDWVAATEIFGDIHRFAEQVSGASPAAATIGFSVCADARDLISGNLVEFSPGRLETLARVMQESIDQPKVQVVAERERIAMLGAVQRVQDALRDSRTAQLEESLGRGVVDAVEDLAKLKGAERMVYFQEMAAAAEAEAEWLKQESQKPLAQRKAPPDWPESGKEWVPIAKHYFLSGRAYLTQHDLHVARTRLMALHCLIRASIARRQVAPVALDSFGTSLTQDPYTGENFVFDSDGRDYILYSPGPDLTDNGGESGDEGLSPDLTVARPIL